MLRSLVFQLNTQVLRSLRFRPQAGLELRRLAYYVTSSLRGSDVCVFCGLRAVVKR